MVSSQQQHVPARYTTIAALVAALLVTGCATQDDVVVEDQPVDPQEATTVGVAVSSPGLVSGIDPAEVSGVEIDIVTAVMQRMETLPADAELLWVPTSATTVAEDLSEVDLAIGQFGDDDFDAAAAQVGPYATVQPGLLVHQEPADDAPATLSPLAPTHIEALSDLEDASVCVVEGSFASGAELPADQMVLEPTVTECEVGMRSGRYDAISADDVQLAGLLVEPTYADRYDLLMWEDLAAETDEEALDEQLFTTGSYWIGVQPEECVEATEALTALVDEGVIAQLFAAFENVEGFTLQTVEADQVGAEHCQGAD